MEECSCCSARRNRCAAGLQTKLYLLLSLLAGHLLRLVWKFDFNHEDHICSVPSFGHSSPPLSTCACAVEGRPVTAAIAVCKHTTDEV